MSPWEIAALMRRHVAAVAVVLILAAGFAFYLKHKDPGYSDSATVAFVLPQLHIDANPAESLLVIDELTANSVMSARGQQQVREAGGAADYDVALVNLYNEEFPNYGVPYVTVTTSSPSAAETQKTFSAVMNVLQHNLARLQAAQGAKPSTWIRLSTISAPTGPVAQTGSPKRTLGALVVLAVIASFLVAKFLDRYPIRPRDLIRKRITPGTAAKDWTGSRASRGVR